MTSVGLFDIKGKVALVTGSSRGLGFTIAEGLGAAGARVVLNGRDPEALAAAEEGLRNVGMEVASASFDITREDQVSAAIERIETGVGAIDILVNNAGIQHRESLESLSEADWRRVIDVNLTGAFIVAKHCAQRMLPRGRGKIINVCSLMSEVGRHTVGPYAAAKGGLKMLTRAMTIDWARYGIQANGIGPGYVKTEMTKPLADDPDFDAWLRARTPAQRWGEPRELVGPVLFLASEAASFVNGQILYVDGGVLASL